MVKRYIYLGMSAILALAGCAGSRGTAMPVPRLLGRDIQSFRASSDNAEKSVSTEAVEPRDTITLHRALALALMKNPELAAYSWDVRAAEARALQASLLPNPEIEVEVEEFDAGGDGNAGGFDTAETTIVLSQLVELGGKRRKRTEVAKLKSELAGWDYEAKRLAVFTETTKAFVNVLASQERVTLAELSAKLAEDIFQTVTERVKAGKVSPLEQIRAKVTLSISQIEMKRSKLELDTARKQLAAMWGISSPRFSTVKGEFETVIDEIPPLAELFPHVSENPNLARRETDVRLKQSSIALEKAGRVPDLTASAGIQQFEETGDDAFTFGFSLSIPLFDRNQGSIREAEHLLAKARTEQLAAGIQIRKKLAEVHQELSSSHLASIMLRKDILPAAKRAFEAARDGYQQGKFGYLEVLDAQRTLFEARDQYIGTLRAYHKAVADVEQLIGMRLDTVRNNPE